MTSEIRANKQTNRVGLGTVTYTDTGIIVSGIVTANSLGGIGHINVGSNIQLGNAGIVTATSFVGSGANLTGITQTTINNNAANKVITGSNTANTLEAVAKNTLFQHLNHGQNFLDDQYLIFGDASDLQLLHQSSGAKSRIRNTNDSGSLDIESTLTRFTNKDGSTEKLRIDSNGNMGLGDTAPPNFTGYRTLSIHGSTGGALVFGDDGTDEWEIYAGDGVLKIYDRANTTERLRIDSSGRVLIGTTTLGISSADDLTLNTSGDTGITIRSGTSNDGNIYFADGTSGGDQYRGYVQYNHQNDYLRFATAATERLRIDSSGRLLVGSTDGATYSDASMDDLIIGSTASGKNDGLTILSGTAQNGSIAFADSGGAYQGLVGYVHNGDYLRFHAGNTLKARIDTDGLKFNSDTAEANALDDYETGTWTPSGTGNAFQVAVGTYTKVGRCVTALFRVRIAASEGANFLQINGLPFDNSAGVQGENIGNISFTTADTSGNMYAAVSTGTAILFYFGTGTNMRYNSTGVPNSHIRGGVVYYTAA